MKSGVLTDFGDLKESARTLQFEPTGGITATNVQKAIEEFVSPNLSALLDAQMGSARGSIIYRGASQWLALAAGTAGQVLQTQGPGADPLWAGTGSGIHINDLLNFGAVGDGTTDNTTAINNWLSSGAVLYAPDGNYKHNSPIVVPNSVRLIFGPGRFTYAGPNAQYCWQVNGTGNLRVKDVAFFADLAISNNCTMFGVLNSDNVLFDGVWFQRLNTYGFDVENSTNCGIVNSRFDANANGVVSAVFLTGGNNLFVRNCVALMNFHNTNGPAIYADTATGIEFSDNLVDRSFGFALQFWNCNSGLIANNILKNSNLESIRIDAGTGPGSTGHLITGNLCDHPSVTGTDYDIGVGGFGTGSNSNVSVKGNLVRLSGHAGISVTAQDSSQVFNVEIDGNIVFRPNQASLANHGGVLVSGSGTASISETIIKNNTLLSNDGKMFYGVFESGNSTFCIVQDNYISGYVNQGVSLSGTGSQDIPALEPWVVGGGSRDAIAGNFPEFGLPQDGQLIKLRAQTQSNLTTTPTFQPNNFTARTITKYGGVPLNAGDIAGFRHELLLMYNSAQLRYELLNPATGAWGGEIAWATGGGTANAITATYNPAINANFDGQPLAVRALLANTDDAPAPTFSPNGLTARAITKYGGQTIWPGDIAGPGHELLLRYNSGTTKYELLNPTQYPFPTIYIGKPSGGDDTDIIQDAINAIAAFPQGGTVKLGPGVFKAHGMSMGTSYVTLEGDSMFGTRIDCNNATVSIMTVLSGTVGVTIKNIGFSSRSIVMNAGTAAIQINDTDETHVRNVWIDGAGTAANTGGRVQRGIWINRTVVVGGYYVNINTFRINFCNEAAIYVSASGDGTTFSHVISNGNIGGNWNPGGGLTAGNAPKYGIACFADNSTGAGVGGTIEISNTNVLQSYQYGYICSNTNYPTASRGSASMSLLKCGSDTNGFDDYNFTNCGNKATGVRMVDCWAGGTQGDPASQVGNGVTLAGCTGAQIIGLTAQGLTGAMVFVTASGGGDSTNILVDGCECTWGNSTGVATWAGIPASGIIMGCAGDFVVTGNIINNTGDPSSNYRYGIWVSGASGNGIVDGNRFSCVTGPAFVQAFSGGGQVAVTLTEWQTYAALSGALDKSKCAGSRAFVTDGPALAFANPVAPGGGTSVIPVYCDNANTANSWRQG